MMRPPGSCSCRAEGTSMRSTLVVLLFAAALRLLVTPAADAGPTGTYQSNACATGCNDCPGGQLNACNGHGTCNDGAGNGACMCFPGYSGTACETVHYCQPGYVSATGVEPCNACQAGFAQPN